MSDTIITRKQVDSWFDDLEETLKSSIVNTALSDQEGREEQYNLFHAAKMLRIRFNCDFMVEVELPSSEYDPD